MATTAYQVWNAKGRPLTPAKPIRDIVERMRVAFPLGAKANIFSWYADDAHYQASNPLDHTPYSETAWPDPLPGYIVTATDIMHRPDLGVNCFDLFNYWIAEARAGRMPWLKYLIWQGKSYSVRTGWVGKTASGHYDHIHISTRTDHLNTSLGTWVLVPGKEESDVTVIARYGEKGDAVKRCQNKLLQVDPDCLPKFGADGGYGDETAAAVKAKVAAGDGRSYNTGDEALLNTVLLQRGGAGGGLTEAQVREIAEDVAEAEIAGTTVTLKPTE